MPLFYSSSIQSLRTQQFDRLGHPGRYHTCLKHTGGITHFLGDAQNHLVTLAQEPKRSNTAMVLSAAAALPINTNREKLGNFAKDKKMEIHKVM